MNEKRKSIVFATYLYSSPPPPKKNTKKTTFVHYTSSKYDTININFI